MTKKELTKMMIQEYEDHKPAAIGIVVIISSVVLIYALLRIVLNVIDSLL